MQTNGSEEKQDRAALAVQAKWWIAVLVIVGIGFVGLLNGCQKEGIYDVDTANKAGEHARRLTSPAYLAISEGRDPSQADLKDLAEGEKVYNDLRKFDPTVWGPWFELGRIDLIQGDNKSAEENFLQFFELTKNDNIPVQKADGYFLKGTALLRMNRADEADRDADQALQFQPDNPTYLLFKAECLRTLKKNQEAKRILIEVLRKYPTSVEARTMLKQLNEAEG